MSLKHRLLSAIIAFLLLCFPFGSLYAASNIYSYRKNDGMKIAITFDDGPHPFYTAKILEILERYHVRATFFLIGSCAATYPDLVKAEIEKGHEIGNHTYSHLKLNGVSKELLQDEISRTDTLLQKLTGRNIKLFRPPEGVCNTAISTLSADLGYHVILWNIDTRDWAHTSSEKIIAHVKRNVKSGDILLFHDYIAKNSPTPAALEVLIPHLLSEGYQFVTVSELLFSDV
jgi:polysaccharide deacetylase family sporulation protein PdaB